MNLPETILQKLRKIEALARLGSEGERENARRLLADLCDRHGVTIEQLTNPEVKPCRFTFANAQEAKLAIQCAVYVCQTNHIKNRKERSAWLLWLTTAQAIDVLECIEHYRRAWRKQLDDTLSAFICSNRIYGPSSEEDESDTKLSAEEAARLRRIAAMSLHIPAQRWQKRPMLNT